MACPLVAVRELRQEMINKNIVWSKLPKHCNNILLTQDEMNAKIELLRNNKNAKEIIIKNKTDKYAKSVWFQGCSTITWHVDDSKRKWTTLYMVDKYPQTFSCNNYLQPDKLPDKAIHAEISGTKVGAFVRKKFKNEYDCGLAKAFHTVSSKQYMACVPQPAYYLNDIYANVTVEDVKLRDVNSMFPAHLCGRLPDSATAMTVNGYTKPNKEYPFAFYLKSHHCAEYGVFDTHDYVNEYIYNKFGKKLLIENNRTKYSNVKPEDEITVLMKPSAYTFDNIMHEQYDIKRNAEKGSEDYLMAKAIMNLFIGTLHRNPENSIHKVSELKGYYHVAAIVIGRANAQIYNTCNELVNNHSNIISIIVDSIIYKGNHEIGNNNKQLGEFDCELDGYFRTSTAINKYVFFDKNKQLKKYVLSGIRDIDKPDITFDTIEIIDQYNKKTEI